jgi:hypothetical protein
MKRGRNPGSPKTGRGKKGSKNKSTKELLEKAEAGAPVIYVHPDLEERE